MLSEIIKKTKKIESLLEENFYASGRGLHEKVTSVETVLDEKLVKKIRWISTIRNKVLHEDTFDVEDIKNIEDFLNNCDIVIESLKIKEKNQYRSDFFEESSRIGSKYEGLRNYKKRMEINNRSSIGRNLMIFFKSSNIIVKILIVIFIICIISLAIVFWQQILTGIFSILFLFLIILYFYDKIDNHKKS